jgi:mannosyltransferase OCH1-like enzyme
MVTVHRIWFGDAPMPDAYVDYGRAWERLGYHVQLWTEQNLPQVVNRDVWDGIAARGVNVGGGNPETGIAVQRADIISYELVWRYGGIYANCDMEPLRRLEVAGAWAAWERQDVIVGSAIFGADRPGDPFWASCVKTARRRWVELPDAIMSEQTGPHLVTAVRQAAPDMVTVHDEREFYPFGIGDDTTAVPPADACTVHHWGHRRA